MSDGIQKYIDGQINALHSVLIGSEVYYYRKICREFSKLFNVSICEVEKMPVDYVLMHYYESTYEKSETNDLIDQAMELCAPELIAKKEAQIDDILKKVEAEGDLDLSKKQKPKQKEPTEDTKQSLTVEPKLPEFQLTFPEE